MPNDIARKSKFARERYHSSTIDIERHKEATVTAFRFGIRQQTMSVHFKLCLAGIVKQGRIIYSWFRDKLMKIRLMMTRTRKVETGHGPGRCATNKQFN